MHTALSPLRIPSVCCRHHVEQTSEKFKRASISVLSSEDDTVCSLTHTFSMVWRHSYGKEKWVRTSLLGKRVTVQATLGTLTWDPPHRWGPELPRSHRGHPGPHWWGPYLGHWREWGQVDLGSRPCYDRLSTRHGHGATQQGLWQHRGHLTWDRHSLQGSGIHARAPCDTIHKIFQKEGGTQVCCWHLLKTQPHQIIASTTWVISHLCNYNGETLYPGYYDNRLWCTISAILKNLFKYKKL